jgi:hypothetical protein
MPESEAPNLFTWDDSDHCFVRKQPSNPEELRQMISAIACADLRCIRYRGRDPEVVSSLKGIGELEQCDHAGHPPIMTADYPEEGDAVPVAADVAPASGATKPSPHPWTQAARVFGGVLALLSLWQILSPVNRADTLLGIVGLVVSALYFLSVRKSFRIFATLALALGVALRVIS